MRGDRGLQNADAGKLGIGYGKGNDRKRWVLSNSLQAGEWMTKEEEEENAAKIAREKAEAEAQAIRQQQQAQMQLIERLSARLEQQPRVRGMRQRNGGRRLKPTLALVAVVGSSTARS